jgi:tetratricopeptide (TPR) repeat protein
LFSNIAGFVGSRKKVNETAESVLPHEYMNKHPNFEPESGLVQISGTGGELVSSWEQLEEGARRALPIFKKAVTKVVEQAGLDPSAVAMHGGARLVLDKDQGSFFTALTVAPLKSKARCYEKVMKEYDNNWHKLVDVVRCSIVCTTEEELEKVAQVLGQTGDSVKLVRLKNRFKHPLFNGYRDALYNVAVRLDDGEGAWHICEIQLHLAAVLSHKDESHHYYEFFRTYFSGNVGAAEDRMDALTKVLEYGENDINLLVAMALGGENVEMLERLVELFDVMGELTLTVPCHQRLVALKGPDDTTQLNRLAIALNKIGNLVDAEPLCRRALEGREETLGAKHPDTLTSVNNLALLLRAQGKLAEAEPLCRRALEGREEMLGAKHPDTLTSVGTMALLLQEQGKLAEAEPLCRRALECREETLGAKHLDTLTSVGNLALLLQEQGKLAEAEPLY